MKKALKIIGIVILVVFLLLLILPFVFKGKIVEIIKREANNNLTAVVDFEDVSISLIRNFPNISVGLENLTVDGTEEFEDVRLAGVEKLVLTLDLMSVISGEQIEVKKIYLDKADIYVKVLADGSANYDIVKESADTTEVAETDSSAMSLGIDQLKISSSSLVYDDATLPMVLRLMQLDLNGKGDFTEDVFTLDTDADIGAVSVNYDGVSYLKNAATSLDAKIAMDMVNMKFTFEENELVVNDLFLGFDGWLAMPAEDIDMDITFFSKKSDFATVLSLVPADFTKDLKDVKTSGQFKLEGAVKGTYNETTMPAFAAKLVIEDGGFQYPDLPKSVENIQVLVSVDSPDGADMDKMTVEIPKFHFEVGKDASNAVDATLFLRTPMSDPFIDTKIVADLDFGSFMDVVPFEGEEQIAGQLQADVAVKGNLSAIENQNFDAFMARGGAELQNFVYIDSGMPVKIPVAVTAFTPQQLELSRLELNYEDISMRASGAVTNYIAYALSDTTLQGRFEFYADRIDLNKFMSEEEEVAETPADTASAPMEIILIPDNLDLVLNAVIDQVLYDEIELNNITGAITVRDEIAALENMKLQTLGGNVGMNGSYNTQNHQKPMVDFSYDIQGLDLQKIARSFDLIQKIAPIASSTTGQIDSKFQMTCALDPTMSPVLETLNGGGMLSSDRIVIEGSDFMQKMATTLKAPALATQTMEDIKVKFKFENGKVITEPFDVVIGKEIDATISGYTTFDQQINYLMELEVPTDLLGGDFNQMAQGLLAKANSALGANFSMGKSIDVDLKITGDISDPSIAPAFGGTGSGENLFDTAKEEIKEQVQEKVEEVKEDVKEEVGKKAEEILAKAREQADKVKAEAAKLAANIRDEADKNAQKLIDEASNPIAKAAAKVAAQKLKDEAYKKADALEAEANAQAENIMKKAQEEVDRLK